MMTPDVRPTSPPASPSPAQESSAQEERSSQPRELAYVLATLAAALLLIFTAAV